MRRTPPAGTGRATLAAIRVTSAPRRAAAPGQRDPHPAAGAVADEADGSIGSRVPPAVTSTRSPSQGRLPAGRAASTRASSAPVPAGGLARTRRGRRAALPGIDHRDAAAKAAPPGSPVSPRLRTCCHSSPGHRATRAGEKEVASIESAAPAASFAIVLAEAGGRGRRRSGRPARGGRSDRGPPARRGKRRGAGRARTRR